MTSQLGCDRALAGDAAGREVHDSYRQTKNAWTDDVRQDRGRRAEEEQYFTYNRSQSAGHSPETGRVHSPGSPLQPGSSRMRRAPERTERWTWPPPEPRCHDQTELQERTAERKSRKVYEDTF